MDLKFRDLKANEIEVRIVQVKEKGLSLVLYKDARCDMNLLDEVVGPTEWQRKHTRDNANCIVSIWDDSKKQWIEKEDTGVESYTEKEKGQASDSFKRACTNWGIGRELYTAPFIWVFKDNANIVTSGKDKYGKDKYTCRDKFSVKEIAIENKRITQLIIKNDNKGCTAFSYLDRESLKNEPEVEKPKEPETVTDSEARHFIKLTNNNKDIVGQILKDFGYKRAQDIKRDDYKSMCDRAKFMA